MAHRSRAWCFVLASVLLLATPAASAYEWDPHLIVIATVEDLESARVEVERASALLEYGIDYSSLCEPESPREAEGPLISVHRKATGQCEVVGYLADQIYLDRALTEVRAHYPDAVVRQAPPGIEPHLYRPFSRRGVVIAGSYRSYDTAIRAAKALEGASGIPLGTRGLVYDESRGLIWPDSNHEDFERVFFERRYDGDCGQKLEAPCLTVEPSEAYKGFEPGYFIIVAGVLDRGLKRDKRLGVVSEFV